MSRSGYNDGIDPMTLGRWRGAVSSAMRGKRGQEFLCEALEALDAMPDKRLIDNNLVADDLGPVCLLGAVARHRKIDVSDLHPDNFRTVAPRFGLAEAMIREIVDVNDSGTYYVETPEQRWIRMRDWIASEIGNSKGD